MVALDRKQVWTTIQEYLLISLGAFLFCASWCFFMIPNGLSSGGLTGLCTIVQYATGGVLQVSYTYAAVNVLLLIAAFFVMGGRFGAKTIYCIALVSVLYEILPMFPQAFSLEGRFLYVPERFMIPLIAGLLEGVGLGIIFRNGGSSGGSDILALMVNKYWPVSPGRFFLVTDCLIVFLLLLLPERTFSDLIYGFLMIGVSAPVVDAVLIGGRSAVQVMVFSDKYAEIADFIIKEMERGVTAIQATGWYTQQEKKVLLIVTRQKEIHTLTKMVKQLDSKAFVSISPANNVYGEGFEEMKTGIPTHKKKQD